MDIVTYIFAWYCVMAFVKFMLCMHSAPLAIGVMSRLAGEEKGKIRYVYVFVVPLALAMYAFLLWVKELWNEGYRFFHFFSDFSVIRSCVEGYRSTHAHSPK